MFEAWKSPVIRVENPYGSSHNPYDRDPLDELPGVMVTGPLTNRVLNRLKAMRPAALYLNGAKGWQCEDYGFLGEVPDLELLSVVAAPLKGPIPIARISGLKSLHLDSALPEAVDLTTLPRLRSCKLSWSAAVTSLFDCRALERLSLAGLKARRFDNLAQFAKLKALSLLGSSLASLKDLAALSRLEHLELKVCRSLENLEGVEALIGLKSLTLNGAHRVHDLGPLAAAEALEVLNLTDCGELDSLAPLAGLRNLKAVAFAGERTKLQDGDLSPLLDLPKLSMVMFGPRRHYSHKIVKRWDWSNLERPDQVLAPK